MKIAPIDIAHKSFSRKMMGFDPSDVSEFLKEVANEMESLIRGRNTLREASREKDLKINEFKERDELLKQTITTATKMSENLHKDAEREAKIIIGDAEHKADMIIADARNSLKKIYEEISDLKRVRMQFENNLKALVHSHLTMMDQGREIMPNPTKEMLGTELQSQEVSPQSSGTNDEDIKAHVKNAVGKAAGRSLDL